MDTFITYFLSIIGIIFGFAIMYFSHNGVEGGDFHSGPVSTFFCFFGIAVMLASFSPIVYEYPSFTDYQYSYVYETTDDGEIVKHPHGTFNLEGTGHVTTVTYSANTHYH